MEDIKFYIPNPTEKDYGLSEVKIGQMIIVYDKNNKRQKFIISGTSSHQNNKVWGLHLTPKSHWDKYHCQQ